MVAIIAVLTAIAIPVFNAQLDKSKKSVDLANIRAGYAELSASILQNQETIATGDYYLGKTGSVATDMASGDRYQCQVAPDAGKVVGNFTTAVDSWGNGSYIKYVYNGSTITITPVASATS